MISSPDQINASELFRNSDLNPSDVVIKERDRQILRDLLRDFDKARRAREADIELWRHSELEALAAANKTTAVPTHIRRAPFGGQDGVAIRAPAAGTVYMLTLNGDNEPVAQSAPVSSLPRTSAAYLERQSIILETGRSTMAFFQGLGALPGAHAKRMFDELVSRLADTYR